MLRPYVKLFVERVVAGKLQALDLGETPSATYENPVYNSRFQFNVANDSDIILLRVIDSQIMGTSM